MEDEESDREITIRQFDHRIISIDETKIIADLVAGGWDINWMQGGEVGMSRHEIVES